MSNVLCGLTADTESIQDLAQEFAACRNEMIGVTRRRSIHSIIKRLEHRGDETFAALELRVRLWRELAREARNQQELSYAWEKTLNSIDVLVSAHSLSDFQKDIAYRMLVEWSIDFSQTPVYQIGINKILAQLNYVTKYLGQQIWRLMEQNAENVEDISGLLCLRAKSQRAIATLLRRRGQGGKKIQLRIDRHKKEALRYAERGRNLFECESSKLELSLCLFANSATPSIENAKRGMELLTSSVEAGADPLSRYELVKQYRLRYKFSDALQVFKEIVDRDLDIRRFHRNITHFSASVIGMYYEGGDPDVVKRYALLALPWIEEMVSQDRHSARDLVDMCYLKAICGWAIEDSIASVDHLKPIDVTTWNELADMAKRASGGEIGDALLLGLEDPVIWSRIGSFYAEFAKDYSRAIEFYERAIHIAPLSPVFHFNKAEALAYGLGDYQSARLSFEYAMRLKHRSYAWYKSIPNKVKRLKYEITKNSGNSHNLALPADTKKPCG